MEFATDINNVMYAYIDRKKNFRLPRSCVRSDMKQIKTSWNSLAWPNEVKGDKKSLNKYLANAWPLVY